MRNKNQGSTEQEFEAWLQAAGTAIRRKRGSCPETETLDRFLTGALPEEEAVEVKSHIAACGVCDLLVEKMKAFEADVAATNDAVPTARAYAVEGRILESLKRAKPGQEGGQPKSTENVIQRLRYGIDLIFWYLRRPAFAYIIVLALLYPAYRGLRPGVQMPPARISPVEAPETPSLPPMVAAPLELQNLRGNGGSSRVIKLTPGERALVLSFVLPTEKGFSYRAEVTNDSDQPVGAAVQLEPNAVGYFTLVYDRKLFGPGKYFLGLFKVPSGVEKSGTLVMQYEFLVEVETEAVPRRPGRE